MGVPDGGSGGVSKLTGSDRLRWNASVGWTEGEGGSAGRGGSAGGGRSSTRNSGGRLTFDGKPTRSFPTSTDKYLDFVFTRQPHGWFWVPI
jgi:hypothetical protein